MLPVLDFHMPPPEGGTESTAQRLGKKVTHRSNGLDQLGRPVGLPRSGDVHRVHVRGSYLAHRPLFRLGGKQYLCKERRIDFLDTHSIGDTAFVNVHVGGGEKGGGNGGVSSSIRPHPKDDDNGGTTSSSTCTLGGLVQAAAAGMMLGESAVFTFDVAAASAAERRSLFDSHSAPMCRGYLGPIKEDATRLILEVDSFRMERDGRHHLRQVRNSGSRTVNM